MDDNHTCCNLDELTRLRDENAKLKAFFNNLISTDERYGGYIPFICGSSPEVGSDGLPDTVHICPAYGSDIVAIYKKVKSGNPEY